VRRIPIERSIYAVRNVDAVRQAEHTGAAIGRYAAALLDSPLPWTRMRRVYALLGLLRLELRTIGERDDARAQAVRYGEVL